MEIYISLNEKNYTQQWLAAIVAQAKTRTKTTAASLAVVAHLDRTQEMNEEILKNFFKGIIPINELANRLEKDFQSAKQEQQDSNFENKPKYLIQKNHLIQLCRATLQNQIRLSHLTKIAFLIKTSDYFTWDTNTTDGSIVDNFVSIWADSEKSDELTIEYLQYCSYYLATGKHR